MPTYRVKLSDGRTLDVQADRQPTEDEILSHMAESPATAVTQAPDIGVNGRQQAHIGPDPHPGASDFKILGVPIHTPGRDFPRADENMADIGGVGIPPESVVMGPLQAGRAMMEPALSMAGRAAAGMSSLASSVAPMVKYEIAKSALMAAGVPSSVATVTAMAVSGYKRGGAARAVETAATEATPAAAVETPSAAASQPSPAPPLVAAPAEAPTAAVLVKPKDFNPGKALTAVRDVFAAIKETPRPAEVSNAMEQMRIGRTAEDAVKQILDSRPKPPASPAEAFSARFNLPSDAAVKDAVARRNATGRWDQ